MGLICAMCVVALYAGCLRKGADDTEYIGDDLPDRAALQKVGDEKSVFGDVLPPQDPIELGDLISPFEIEQCHDTLKVNVQNDVLDITRIAANKQPPMWSYVSERGVPGCFSYLLVEGIYACGETALSMGSEVRVSVRLRLTIEDPYGLHGMTGREILLEGSMYARLDSHGLLILTDDYHGYFFEIDQNRNFKSIQATPAPLHLVVLPGASIARDRNIVFAITGPHAGNGNFYSLGDARISITEAKRTEKMPEAQELNMWSPTLGCR